MSSEWLEWVTYQHYQLNQHYLFARTLPQFKEDNVASLKNMVKCYISCFFHTQWLSQLILGSQISQKGVQSYLLLFLVLVFSAEPDDDLTSEVCSVVRGSQCVSVTACSHASVNTPGTCWKALDFTILMATLKKDALKWMSTTSAVPWDSVVFGLFITLTAVICPWMASLLCSLYCKVSNSLFKSAAATSGVWAEDEHKGLKRKSSTNTVKANHCAGEGRLNSTEQQVPSYYLTGGLKKIFWIFDKCA